MTKTSKFKRHRKRFKKIFLSILISVFLRASLVKSDPIPGAEGFQLLPDRVYPSMQTYSR